MKELKNFILLKQIRVFSVILYFLLNAIHKNEI